MKTKLLITALLGLSLAQPLQAKEIAPGTIEIAGSSALAIGSTESTNSVDGYKETDDFMALSLLGGYYIQSNILIGAQIAKIDSTTSFNDGTPDFTFSQFMLSPVVALDINLDPQSNIMLMLGLAGALIGNYSAQSGNNPASEGSVSGTILSATYKKFLTDSVALDLSLNKTTIDSKPDNSSITYTDDTTDFEVGVSVLF